MSFFISPSPSLTVYLGYVCYFLYLPHTHACRGQRKLLMSEIEFLNTFAQPGDVVVYAGAAPGDHTNYLSDLFPYVNMVLVDPNDFRVDPSPRIRIINDFFTDDLAVQLRGDNVLFISDIRTADPSKMSVEEVEVRVGLDNDAQMRWHRLINARHSMLKFRLPYLPGTTQYLDGFLWLPIWGRCQTSEMRLVAARGCPERLWCHTAFEEQSYRFNLETRVAAYPHKVDVPGLDHCYDCAAEVEVVSEYLLKHPKQIEALLARRLQRRSSHRGSGRGAAGSTSTSSAARTNADGTGLVSYASWDKIVKTVRELGFGVAEDYGIRNQSKVDPAATSASETAAPSEGSGKADQPAANDDAPTSSIGTEASSQRSEKAAEGKSVNTEKESKYEHLMGKYPVLGIDEGEEVRPPPTVRELLKTRVGIDLDDEDLQRDLALAVGEMCEDMSKQIASSKSSNNYRTLSSLLPPTAERGYQFKSNMLKRLDKLDDKDFRRYYKSAPNKVFDASHIK